jgi:hypothetical protein
MATISFGSGLIQHNQPLAMTTFATQAGEAFVHIDPDTTRETLDARARGGSDTTAAQDLLRQIEAAQEKFVSYRDWLLKELKNSTW